MAHPSLIIIATGACYACLLLICFPPLPVSAFTSKIIYNNKSNGRSYYSCRTTASGIDNNKNGKNNNLKLIASMTSSSDASLNYLTPELEKMTNAFASLTDEKTRYKQLLFMANKLPPLPESCMTPENKVPGCLSTVYVDCSAEKKEDGDVLIHFRGDSDGQLTKGLVAFLVKGFSGCTAEQINNVDPSFIHTARISQSLTPGRNNGFLNMIATMKQKAKEAANNESTNNDVASTKAYFEPMEGKPIYNTIMSTLSSILKPSKISLTDTSASHAGHAGSRGYNGESHFVLSVVADAFEGLPLVKRHQLIYMLLGDVMSQIHALNIEAKAPSEI